MTFGAVSYQATNRDSSLPELPPLLRQFAVAGFAEAEDASAVLGDDGGFGGAAAEAGGRVVQGLDDFGGAPPPAAAQLLDVGQLVLGDGAFRVELQGLLKADFRLVEPLELNQGEPLAAEGQPQVLGAGEIGRAHV